MHRRCFRILSTFFHFLSTVWGALFLLDGWAVTLCILLHYENPVWMQNWVPKARWIHGVRSHIFLSRSASNHTLHYHRFWNYYRYSYQRLGSHIYYGCEGTLKEKRKRYGRVVRSVEHKTKSWQKKEKEKEEKKSIWTKSTVSAYLRIWWTFVKRTWLKVINFGLNQLHSSSNEVLLLLMVEKLR